MDPGSSHKWSHINDLRKKGFPRLISPFFAAPISSYFYPVFGPTEFPVFFLIFNASTNGWSHVPGARLQGPRHGDIQELQGTLISWRHGNGFPQGHLIRFVEAGDLIGGYIIEVSGGITPTIEPLTKPYLVI